MEIDALGTFATSRAAFPALQKAGGGSIVNISATLQYGATWWQVPALCTAFTCGHCQAARLTRAGLPRAIMNVWA